MGNDTCFLITVLSGNSLIKCALKVSESKIDHRVNINFDDVTEFPMEPENRAFLGSLLPDHVRDCGPIVAVSTDLFEVHEYT